MRIGYNDLARKGKTSPMKTRLKNMKRKYAKMIQDPALAEECIEIKADIDSIEMEIKAMK